jgi:hypothetical protein
MAYGWVFSEQMAERLSTAQELELTDDTARDALAVQLFGKSTQALLADLGQNCQQGSRIRKISQSQID